MNQMLNIPEWLPSWVQLVILVLILLWALSLLAMPFSVFGLKSRLEAIETRLDDIHAELRQIGARGISGGPVADYDDVYPARMAEPRSVDRILSRPPVPPARHDLYPMHDPEPLGDPMLEDRAPPSPNARPARRAEPAARPMRAEPRLDWRR